MARLGFGAAGGFNLLGKNASKKGHPSLFKYLEEAEKAGKVTAKIDKSLEPGTWEMVVSENDYKKLMEAQALEVEQEDKSFYSLMMKGANMISPKLAVIFGIELTGKVAGTVEGDLKGLPKRSLYKFSGGIAAEIAANERIITKLISDLELAAAKARNAKETDDNAKADSADADGDDQ